MTNPKPKHIPDPKPKQAPGPASLRKTIVAEAQARAQQLRAQQDAAQALRETAHG